MIPISAMIPKAMMAIVRPVRSLLLRIERKDRESTSDNFMKWGYAKIKELGLELGVWSLGFGVENPTCYVTLKLTDQRRLKGNFEYQPQTPNSKPQTKNTTS